MLRKLTLGGVAPWTFALSFALAGCLPGMGNNEQSTAELNRGGSSDGTANVHGGGSTDPNTGMEEPPPTPDPGDPSDPTNDPACQAAIQAYDDCQSQSCAAEQAAAAACDAQWQSACSAELSAYETCAQTGAECLAEREAYGLCLQNVQIDCSLEYEALSACVVVCEPLLEQIGLACRPPEPPPGTDPCTDAQNRLNECYTQLDCSAQDQAAQACAAQIDQLCTAERQAFESCMQTNADPLGCLAEREAYGNCLGNTTIDCSAEYEAVNACYSSCRPIEEELSWACNPPQPTGDACSLLQAALEACLSAPPAPCGCDHGGGTMGDPNVPAGPEVCQSIVVAIDQVCSAAACQGGGR